MNRTTRYTALGGILTAWIALAFASQPPAGQDAPSDRELIVPDGFTVERVAGPPLVNRPIVADFDEAGRLYVADSSGSNDRTERQLQDRPHRIVRLEDTNGDGRFDASVVFADRMMLPEGAMWFDGSLYVAAPPSIWRLTDTDGDGVADEREEWFQGKTLTGCANDLHGPYLGPDGWIYWTKGAFAEQTYERPGGAPFVTRASHIFRRRPGDPAIDVVMTGGMDNPVDVAFTATGERILTATFVEHPQLGRRDALLHAVYGGVYGKPHGVLDGHTRTGDLMPVLAHLGPAVPAGLTRYASRAFGDAYRDSFFAAMFNLHKVTRFVLEPGGGSFTASASDFLVSTNRDFHPTDVLEDADGSLLVIDTGPWYKLCCPTSQLAKPDVPGAIYRVRRTGARTPDDPRGTRIAWSTLTAPALAGLLANGRVAVQNRAIHQVSRAAGAVPALLHVLNTSASVDARRNAVWALTRIDSAQAREAVRFALSDRNEGVRQAAVHAAGLWRDRAALPQLVETLQSPAPTLQRAAAEALGRLGDARAVPGLLAAAAPLDDRVLEHSLTYAIIEIGDGAAARAGLQAPSARTRRAALIALDQIDGERLSPDAIVPLLDAEDPIIEQTAWWIAERHPEWGAALAEVFRTRLEAAGAASDRDDLQQTLARFAASAGIQTLLADAVARSPSLETRRTALAAMANTHVKVLPLPWIDPVARALADDDPDVVRHAILVLRAVPPPADAAEALHGALARVARDSTRPLDLRLAALAAFQGSRIAIDAELFDLLRRSLSAAQPVSIRVAAAGIVEKAALDPGQLRILVGLLEQAGPLELPRLLPPFDAAPDEALGFAMIEALERAASRSAVRADVLRPRLAKYPESVRARGEALLSTIHVESAAEAQRLETLLAGLGSGDVRRGQQVFNSEKAACASCHAIGYLGGTIGPDLTRIGEVRGDRDLLEAVVFPSASFARGYEPLTVTTTRGEIHSGVVRSERGDEVVLATAAGQEVRLPRSEIADMRPGTVSLMPPGLDEQLTRQELADLLAFLKATRWGAN